VSVLNTKAMQRQEESILAHSGRPGNAPSASIAPDNPQETSGGMLIVNADDWGRDHDTTEPIRQCLVRGTVSSVSAMVFMEDSEPAADIARERRFDAGLHLNFSTSFTASNCPPRLAELQNEVAAYLLRHPLARVVFHPGLVRSFEYVVAAQMDEYRRLYGAEPQRIDGHHHLHLCANVLFGGLLPAGTVVRRNFTFHSGERSLINRLYRQSMDHILGRNHRLVDFLFSLAPLEPFDRLRRVVALAHRHVVEVETHPINPEELAFLMGGQIFDLVREFPIASSFTMPIYQVAPAGGSRWTQGEA
jgi:hypothetical protein